MRFLYFSLFLSLFASCSYETSKDAKNNEPYLIVLGIAQDGGFPQAGCTKNCCKKVWNNEQARKMVSCLGLIDPVSHQKWMFDATPDFKNQLHILQNQDSIKKIVDGIFLTHAHIGHYAGLINLGKEVMGAKNIEIYAMPRMKDFISTNGPWNQLIGMKNIAIQSIFDSIEIKINNKISVTPFLVPHRDEFSETVGYKIKGPSKTAIFIPDIDKWQKWNKSIVEEIKKVDYAFIDGTFFKDGEISRNMSQVPHPFVSESIELFRKVSKEDKEKIYFIHLNHTNPLLFKSEERKMVEKLGFNIAEEQKRIVL